jgi:hypothetical protein
VEEQEEAKINYKQTPTTLNRETWHALQEQVAAAFSTDQEDFMNSQLRELELASQKREYGTIWQLVNKIAGQKKKSVIVRKLDESLPKDKAEILGQWSTYFSTLLNNKNAYADPANLPQPSPDNSQIPTTRIARGEITRTRLRYDS